MLFLTPPLYRQQAQPGSVAGVRHAGYACVARPRVGAVSRAGPADRRGVGRTGGPRAEAAFAGQKDASGSALVGRPGLVIGL